MAIHEKLAIYFIQTHELIRNMAIHNPKPYEFMGDIAIYFSQVL